MTTEAPSRITVGVDGSESSLRALRWAAALAAGLDAVLVVVHAFQPLDHLGEVKPGTDFAELLRQTEGRMREEWCAEAAALGATCLPVVADGTPADVLLDTARRENADLIVVGARGLGKVRELVLGSTSSKLAHSSPVPVTIVPAKGS